MFESSLVKYENPQLIAKRSTKALIEANRMKAEKMALMNIDELMEEDATTTIDMLDVLMPPRIVEDSNNFWCQRVSRSPASKSDLLHLQERFDSELADQNAREMGLCDIRRKLYDQLFDELIRQEIIACPERGRLFGMIRRETQLSITSLYNCYESGIAYGIKKKCASQIQKDSLTGEVTRLLSKIAELNDIISDLEVKVIEVKENAAATEAKKVEEFTKLEEAIRNENEELLSKLEEYINVTIEEDV